MFKTLLDKNTSLLNFITVQFWKEINRMCALKSRKIYDWRQLYMGMGNNHGIVFTKAELLESF